MKLIHSSFEIIEQEPGLQGIYKAIEVAGRVSHKSEDKITDDSAKKFVDKMISIGHGSALEFGTVYLKHSVIEWSDCELNLLKLKDNKFTEYNYKSESGLIYITTNYRVIMQGEYKTWDEAQKNNYDKNWLSLLEYLCNPTKFHTKRICVKFITDRGVSHELVRHRAMSFLQESTRYCNYSKGKFGNELTYIIPSWFESKTIEGSVPLGKYLCVDNSPITDRDEAFVKVLSYTEQMYLYMLKNGCNAQEARQVLPNALKTEIYVCGFIDKDGWGNFFKLRDDKQHAHPDMYALAHPLHEEFTKRGLL